MAAFLPEKLVKDLKSPLVLPFTLYLSVSFATQLLEIPLLRLFENAICNRHYRFFSDNLVSVFTNIDETLCKIPAVQDQLSIVVGWKLCFDAIRGIYTFTTGGIVQL